MHEGVGKERIGCGGECCRSEECRPWCFTRRTGHYLPTDPTNKIASWEHGKIKSVGRIGKMVFLEISEECKPGGLGHE